MSPGRLRSKTRIAGTIGIFFGLLILAGGIFSSRKTELVADEAGRGLTFQVAADLASEVSRLDSLFVSNLRDAVLSGQSIKQSSALDRIAAKCDQLFGPLRCAIVSQDHDPRLVSKRIGAAAVEKAPEITFRRGTLDIGGRC